jgi:NAD(P)H-dependent FMN reductase
MEQMRLAVIVGSTRSGRFGPTVAAWFAGRARRRRYLDVDVIDLASAELPDRLGDIDDDTPPNVRALKPRLAAADAYAVVTPEYNRSFPAPLKTAIDWYVDEWRTKPVTVVSYGRESGGLYATEQLRQVFTELHAVTVRDTVSLPYYWDQFAPDGSWPNPSAGCETAADTSLDQLCWWACVLREARAHHPYPEGLR